MQGSKTSINLREQSARCWALFVYQLYTNTTCAAVLAGAARLLLASYSCLDSFLVPSLDLRQKRLSAGASNRNRSRWAIVELVRSKRSANPVTQYYSRPQV